MSNDPNQTQGPWNDQTEQFVPPQQPPSPQPPSRLPPAWQQPPQQFGPPPMGQQQPPQQFQVGQQPPQQFGPPPMGQQPQQQFGPPPMGQQFQQQPYQATQQTYQQAPQQFGPPPVGQRPPQRSAGRTSRLLWIAIAAVVVIVLVIAILAGVSLLRSSTPKTSATPTAGTIVVPTKTQAAAGATEARAVAGNYYSAIQQQDYTKAYSYLDTSVVTVQGQPATQQGFTLLAQTLDQTKGKVSSFTITGSKVTGGTAMVTVKVTRNGQSYDVHLTLKQEGSDWKITSFDNI